MNKPFDKEELMETHDELQSEIKKSDEAYSPGPMENFWELMDKRDDDPIRLPEIGIIMSMALKPIDSKIEFLKEFKDTLHTAMASLAIKMQCNESNNRNQHADTGDLKALMSFMYTMHVHRVAPGKTARMSSAEIMDHIAEKQQPKPADEFLKDIKESLN